MGSPAINLSAGLVPTTAAPATAGGDLDLSAGMVPTAGKRTPPPAQAPSVALADNPHNEGVYQMKDSNGRAVGVPYSKVSPLTRSDSGYNFASSDEQGRYLKDLAHDPAYLKTTNDFAQGSGSMDVMNAGIGVAKDVAQIPNTLTGWLDALINKADPNHPSHLKEGLEAGENKIAPGITDPLQGGAEHTGAVASELAQWMTGEGLLKAGMSFAEKTAAISKFAKTLEQFPALAKTLRFSLRTAATGAGAGAQTLAHGGTADEARTAAELGAGGSAAAEGAAAAVRGTLARLARPATTAEGVGTAARGVVEDRLAATNATRSPVPPAENPKDFHFRIEGTPTRDTTEGSIAQQPQKVQVGHRVLEGKGPSERQVYPPPQAPETQTDYVDVNNGDPNAPGNHRSPTYRLTEDSRPGSVTKTDSAAGGGILLTKDVKTASAHLASLDQIIGGREFASMTPEEQAGYRAQRADMQQQIGDYYRHQKAVQGSAPAIGPPTQVQKVFKPVDAQAAIKATGSFADAAQQLHDVAAPVYEHANDVSGGQWQTLDKSVQENIAKLGDISDVPNNRTARAKLISTISQEQSKLSQILDDPRNGFDAEDVAQAKKNFRAKYLLLQAHEATKPIYAIEQQPGLVTGQYRGFNGQQLGARWQEFLRDNPDAKDIIGSDRVQTLSRLFQANETLASRKRFGAAVLAVAGSLAGAIGGSHSGVGMVEGAGLGGGAAAGGYYAIRQVLDGMIQNPKVAKSLLFAIDAGARTENYAPGLAKMVAETRAGRGVAAQAAAKAMNDGDMQ